MTLSSIIESSTTIGMVLGFDLDGELKHNKTHISFLLLMLILIRCSVIMEECHKAVISLFCLSQTHNNVKLKTKDSINSENLIKEMCGKSSLR